MNNFRRLSRTAPKNPPECISNHPLLIDPPTTIIIAAVTATLWTGSPLTRVLTLNLLVNDPRWAPGTPVGFNVHGVGLNTAFAGVNGTQIQRTVNQAFNSPIVYVTVQTGLTIIGSIFLQPPSHAF
jgi:hypothetical protein